MKSIKSISITGNSKHFRHGPICTHTIHAPKMSSYPFHPVRTCQSAWWRPPCSVALSARWAGSWAGPWHSSDPPSERTSRRSRPPPPGRSAGHRSAWSRNLPRRRSGTCHISTGGDNCERVNQNHLIVWIIIWTEHWGDRLYGTLSFDVWIVPPVRRTFPLYHVVGIRKTRANRSNTGTIWNRFRNRIYGIVKILRDSNPNCYVWCFCHIELLMWTCCCTAAFCTTLQYVYSRVHMLWNSRSISNQCGN